MAEIKIMVGKKTVKGYDIDSEIIFWRLQGYASWVSHVNQIKTRLKHLLKVSAFQTQTNR